MLEPSPTLTPPTPIAVEVLDERGPEVPPAERFLDVRRVTCRLLPRGGPASQPFAYDAVVRRALDAAVIAAHTRVGGAVHVLLRSALRVPLALRDDAAPGGPVLWELPAGLVEPGETPVVAAQRELLEEAGVEATPLPLGPSPFPAPAVVGELHHFFHAAYDEAARRAPLEDGSVLEAHAELALVPLAEALAACRDGRIRDAKTELGLRRLAEVLA